MKKTVIELSIVIAAGLVLLGLVYYKKHHVVVAEAPMCSTDVMMCPDGTSIPRTGPNCEFALCKQELPYYLQATASTTTSSSSVVQSSTTKKETTPVATTFFGKVTNSATSLFKGLATTVKNDIASGIKETTQAGTSGSPSTHQATISPSTPPANSEVRYNVIDNQIVNASNTPIYTLPPSPPSNGGGGGSSTTTWETHPVNVIPIGQIPPVIGAIPVNGLPGKYYLSENSFGNIELCEFSNKVYILDTVTNTKTLMYEENSTMLPSEDPRSCSSEMYLLATESDKLILKYHTIGTNMTCDSTWSEPEKTWYLTVTHLENGTRRYVISPELYLKAQEMEAACRLNFGEATTTDPGTIGG